MRQARNIAQPMKYSLLGTVKPKYALNDDGSIKYYIDSEGNEYPIETGETEIEYSEPIDFMASIKNKVDEVLERSFGIDDSTNVVQLTAPKGTLPLKVGAIIWKQSKVEYVDGNINDKSADYIVKGVADEGINIDIFLLQKITK